MLETKTYKSAPITEAVIELRIENPSGFDIHVLENLAEELKPDFPKQVPMQLLQIQTQPQPVGQAISQSVGGYRLAKADDSRVLQIRRDGFAYSHMAPYSKWAIFSQEARSLWGRYREALQSARLFRCALRYINRIDIPARKIEESDYFCLYPKLPDALKYKDVIGMSLNVQIPQYDLECVANVIEGFIEPVMPDHLSFLLDIDIFRTDIGTWEDEMAWQFLEKLRERKNEIFEACITDTARKLFDK